MKLHTLLAKSVPKGESIPYAAKLPGHLEQVVEAIEYIVDSLDIFLTRQFEEDVSIQSIKQLLRVAAVLHDLGKINSDFQNNIHGIRTLQVIRHEVVSEWIAFAHLGLARAIESMWDKYPSLMPWGPVALRSAILGHHLKYSRVSIGTENDPDFFLHWNHPDMDEVYQLIESVFNEAIDWSDRPQFQREEDWIHEHIFEREEEVWLAAIESLTEVERRCCSLVRGLLIAADMLGSVESVTREQWLTVYLPEIRRSLIEADAPRKLELIINSRLENCKPDEEINKFQQEVARSASSCRVTVVEAGCGSGKTLAGYMWGKETGCRSAFFMYPTTATATQGYKDYALDLGIADLKHSRSGVDQLLFEEFGRSALTEATLLFNGMEQESYTEKLAKYEDESLSYQALQEIVRPITICTADTVLGFLQNYRSALILLPKLLQSAVVFDEIHSYDDRLFRHLLQFLHVMKVPTLLMTASLQPERRKLLEEALADTDTKWLKGDMQREREARYRVFVWRDVPIGNIREALSQGKKVLCVCNTVDRATSLYNQIQEQLGAEGAMLKLYHSRFKYVDRYNRQSEIMRLFVSDQPCCVITTQICEMSFDVSAHMLCSEIAPPASLIQRLGRLHRRQAAGVGPGEAHFWMPEGYKPYEEEEIAVGEQFVRSLSSEPSVSQHQLSELLKREGAIFGKVQDPPFSWLELQTCVPGHSLRDADQYAFDFVLASDYEKVERLGKDEISKYVLPVPMPKRIMTFEFWRHVRIVDDKEMEYCVEIGGRWRT